MMSAVSIIIPVYNTAKYMDECMKSVLGQTFKDLEIILVDDGSTDGVSPAKCDEFALADKRVKVIHKENGGLISARIAGTEAATSNDVSYLDSDDWIDLDMIEKLFEHTDSSFASSEIISGNYIIEKAGERRKETQGLAPGVYTGDSLEKVKRTLMGNEVRPVTMSRCMKLISRSLVLDNIKYCDLTIVMAEDVNIMLPCLCDCKRLVIMEGAHFYHYRLVVSSMAHGYNPRLLENIRLTDRTFRGILKSKGIENGEEMMDREFIIMLFLVLKSELRCPEKDTSRRVKAVFLNPEIRQKISSTAVEINGTANKLLYFCMRHPASPVIGITNFIIRSYDKKTNS